MRLSSFSYVGTYQYFVTFCTHLRQSRFTTAERIDCVRSQILHTCAEKDFEIPAGVFMRDHVHLLVRGLSDRSDFKRCMTRLRQMSASEFKRRFQEILWQRGYHERVLRNVDEAPAIIAYIAANPVREGLAPESDEYPYLWTPDKKYAHRADGVQHPT
jgi:putative transposase